MSLVFSDTSTKKGIIQELESELGFNDGEISGNTTLLKKFTASINQAFDDFTRIAIASSGLWEWDDSNQTDLPFITANLVGSPTPQRDYSFTTDGSSNLILDIYKVLILPSATATTYVEIEPANENDDVSFIDGSNTSGGIPSRYAKRANAILLDPMPNYNATAGLKVIINREASYFTSSDTTKKPGVPGILHKYFYLKPAAEYARRNSLANAQALALEVTKMEGIKGVAGTIEEYFTRRERDVRNVMTPEPVIYE